MSKASPEMLAEMEAELMLYRQIFGHLVNQMRNEMNLSQSDFGDSVGVSRTEMHNVEGGETVGKGQL